LRRKINDTLSKAYEFIPDDMSIFYSVGSGPLSDNYKPSISADNFIYKS